MGNGPGYEANARSRGGLIDKIFFNKSVLIVLRVEIMIGYTCKNSVF